MIGVKTKTIDDELKVWVTNSDEIDRLERIGEWYLENDYADSYFIESNAETPTDIRDPELYALWVYRQGADPEQQRVLAGIYFKKTNNTLPLIERMIEQDMLRRTMPCDELSLAFFRQLNRIDERLLDNGDGGIDTSGYDGWYSPLNN